MEGDLALALRLADVADEISLARFLASDLVVDTKPDLTPVTEADRAVERALRAALADERPDDGILGEEFGGDGPRERTWIIDPIDGTKNYVRGVPVWATLIGLRVGDEITVGVVSAPALPRRWWAHRGGGAWVREPWRSEPRRLSVSRVGVVADASVSISDRGGFSARGLAGLERILTSSWRQRGYGDFWSHILVAEGAVDLTAEPGLQDYDMAALIPVVTEAGGRITAFDGGPALGSGHALTTNGALHAEAVALLSG